MIKANGGHVEFSGTTIELMAEYAAVTESLFEMFVENYGEVGNSLVKRAYKMGKNAYKEDAKNDMRGEDKNENHI